MEEQDQRGGAIVVLTGSKAGRLGRRSRSGQEQCEALNVRGQVLGRLGAQFLLFEWRALLLFDACCLDLPGGRNGGELEDQSRRWVWSGY